MSQRKLVKYISLIIVSVLSISVFTACTLGGESPEQSLANALNAFKNYDEEVAKRYGVYEDLTNLEANEKESSSNGKKMGKLICKNLDFKIKSSSIDGDTATVKTEITSIDMKLIMGEYMSKAMELAMANTFTMEEPQMSEEELNKKTDQIFVDMLSRKDNKKVTVTVDVKLNKNEDYWVIDIDKDLEDALFGGAVTFKDELKESGWNISE